MSKSQDKKPCVCFGGHLADPQDTLDTDNESPTKGERVVLCLGF